MENRNYTDLRSENMVSPSIFNTAFKAPQPTQVQQMPVAQPEAILPLQMETPQQIPIPTPMPKPMPAPQPIYIPQPAPMPKQMPQPKPMTMPQPIIVEKPAQQHMPQPIIVQQPAPQPMPQPTQVQQMEINIQLVYPEVFYRLQPHVKKACDRMDIHSAPTQEMLDSLSEAIHDEVCRAHPDISDYVYGQAGQETIAPRKKCCCNPCRNICGGDRPRRNPYTDRGPFHPPRPPYPPYQPYPRPPYPPYPPYPYPIGNRGILGDLIAIMLLNEFYRRRR